MLDAFSAQNPLFGEQADEMRKFKDEKESLEIKCLHDLITLIEKPSTVKILAGYSTE